jgi:hypothetical protein
LQNSSFVLRALNILGLEEILKLSEVLRIKQVPLKKAAGEELVTWSETQEEVPRSEPKPPSEAKVLAFPKKTIKQFEELESEQREIIEAKAEARENLEKVPEGTLVMPSDVILWQREIMKDSDGAIQKIDAMKGYQRSTQMYMVKSKNIDGKEKIRFIATNGILINKKQA